MAGLARRGVAGLIRRKQSVRPFGARAAVAYDSDDWEEELPAAVVEDVQRKSYAGIQWVFLGCPGVGKGTYASRIALGLQVPYIPMGDLVRDELARDTPLSKELASLMSRGKLLPDELILGLLTKRLEEASATDEAGFILDGFPRTTSQAKTLDYIADIGLVVNLKLREDILVAKCLGRRTCSDCGNVFNLTSIDVSATEAHPRIVMPPLLPPRHCANKMIMRADDTEEMIRERLRAYTLESKPVEDYYRAQGKLIDFDILGGIPETWSRLLTALNLQDRLASRVVPEIS